MQLTNFDKWLVLTDRNSAMRYGDILNEADWYDTRDEANLNAKIVEQPAIVVRVRIDFQPPIKKPDQSF